MAQNPEHTSAFTLHILPLAKTLAAFSVVNMMDIICNLSEIQRWEHDEIGLRRNHLYQTQSLSGVFFKSPTKINLMLSCHFSVWINVARA